MELTHKNVEDVFADCVSLNPAQDTTTTVHGVRAEWMLGDNFLDFHRQNIAEMLLQLPKPFRRSVGGGWTFLNMCNREDEVQWTDLHQTMDKLVMLGLAIGRLKYLIEERDVWPKMPGGMPYVVVLD